MRYIFIVLTTLLAVTICTKAAAAFTDGLEGYWQFNGNGTDSSPAGRDVDLYGGVGFATGLFGQSLDLYRDPNLYTQRPGDDTVYDFGSGDFTIQVWVNFNDTTGEHTMIEKFSNSNGPGWTISTLTGNKLHFYAAPSAALTSGSLTMPTGVWHHVVARKSGASFDLWFNGGIVASGSDPDPVPDTYYPLLIGKRNDDDGRNFAVDGRLDEIAIWTRALTLDEIDTLYNSGEGTLIPEPTTIMLISLGALGMILRQRRHQA